MPSRRYLCSLCLCFNGGIQPRDCHSLRTRIHLDSAVSCGLIDMYAKCGFNDLGYLVFELMSEKKLIAYNADIFNQMYA